MRVLGIETSCDETAAALVERSEDGRATILSDRVLSQTEIHAPFGGVVPEVAARAHLDHLDRLIGEALREASCGFDGLDAIAVTAGPGLIGGVLVGTMEAKAIALSQGLPFIAVNHLEAHALSARLVADIAFPYLLLLVSGGHAQFQVVRGVGDYVRLGTTIDDAPGEAFDKAAKLLGLGYPGGPEIERWAEKGDGTRFDLPRPMRGRAGCDFSFSGLKAAVARTVARLEKEGPVNDQTKADMAAAFQSAVTDTIVGRTKHAIEMFSADYAGDTLVVAGGVAANGAVREGLDELAAKNGLRLVAPPRELCTDNGAMVAWAGLERLRLGLTDDLDFKARPRWALDPDAPKRPFAGSKA